MKMENQNRGSGQSRRTLQGCDPKSKKYLFLCPSLCFYIFSRSFLAICLIISAGCAETGVGERESLLEFHLGQHSQDVNTSNIPKYPDTSFPILESQTQVSALQAAQSEISPSSNVAVSSSAKVSYQSGPNEVPVFRSGQDFSGSSYEESSKPVPSLQNDLLIAKGPTTYLGRQLWHARISVPEDKQGSQSKNELRQIIKQINSVKFKPQDQTPKPLIVVEAVSKAEPNKISSGTEMLQQPPQKNERKLPYEQITEQTLQMLKNL